MTTESPRLRIPLVLAALVAGLLIAAPFGVHAATQGPPSAAARAVPASIVVDAGPALGAPLAASPCQAACDRRSRELYRACVAGGLSTRECHLRSRRAYQDCVARNCTERPTQLTCEGQCEQAGRAYRDRCLAAGGLLADCDRQAREYVSNCTAAQCQARPITCTDGCKARARAAYEACIAAGGSIDRCNAVHDEAYAACLRDCSPPAASTGLPTRTATPTSAATATCSQECERRAKEVYEACIAAGNSPTLCAAQAQAALEECILRQCGPSINPTRTFTPRATLTPSPSPTATCGQDCARRSREVYEACIASGQSPDECAAQAKAALDECLIACGTVTPTLVPTTAPTETSAPTATTAPTPTCRERCERRAAEALAACLEAGGSQLECAAQAQAVLLECVTTLCEPNSLRTATPTSSPTPTPAAAPTCREDCENKARQVLADCLAMGGSADDCRLKAQAALDECSAACMTPCEADCKRKADAARAACLARSLSPDECDRQAATVLANCLLLCPSLVGSRCVSECQVLGRGVYDSCLRGGGSPEVCLARQQQAVAECIAAKCRP